MKFISYLLGTLLLLSACASEQKLQSLDDTLKLYQASFRWSKFDDLGRFQRGVEPISDDNYKKLKTIKVTSYEEKNRIVTEDYMQAEQTVQIRYYNENTGVEKQIVDRQLWKYDDDKGVWYLSSPLPAFGKR